MKKQLLVFCLFFVTAITTASAQEAKRKEITPEERATKRAAMLKQKLNLNDKQVKELEVLFVDQEKEMEVIKEQMRKQRESYEKSLSNIFTPEQMKQFKEAQNERKEIKADIKEQKKDPAKDAK
jgi:Spy/CpxP family protein refolding chaperone